MAEGITKTMFKGNNTLHARSAGLYAVPGNPPSKNAIDVCGVYGIDIRDHRAQPLSQTLLNWADLIFCMEEYQDLEIRTLARQEVPIRLLGRDIEGVPDEIPDPYGGDPHVYEETFRFLTQAIVFHLGRFEERRRYDREAEAAG